jgi:deoxyadenosine/deoxycytidine kinase
MRIEVCGGIAAGKTTLARLMRRAGYKAVLENYQSNPFLHSFNTDPKKYSFETELTFLLQHYSQIKGEHSEQKLLVCDYSLYLDLAYAVVTLNKKHGKVFNVVHKVINSELGLPSLLIYLRCSAETELKRIKRRRRFVERFISVDYLDGLNSSLELCISKIRNTVSIIELDSERMNFANDPDAQARTIDLVIQAQATMGTRI